MNLSELVHSLEPDVQQQLGTDEDDTREYALVCLYALQKVRGASSCTPRSVAASILTAARLRLVPGLGLGYFAVEKNEKGPPELVFVPKWQGLVELLREHANVVDVQAFTVHAHDKFIDVRGSRPKFYFQASRGERGHLVACAVEIFLANGGEHREVLYKRGDIDPVMPDGNEPEDSPRSETQHDYYERVKTIAVKRAAKWFACGPEICAAIELERAAERSKVRPRAEDVAVMLGIELRDSYTHANEGGPEGSSKAIADSQADRSDHTQGVPGASGPPVPNTNPLKLRCCGCGNNDKPVYRSKAFSLIGHNSETCQTESTAKGTFHDLCGSCRDAHYKAWGEERQIQGEKASKRLAKRAAKKSAASGPGAVAAAMGVRPGSHDLAPDQETASAAAPADGRMDSSSAASTKAEDLASSANDGPAEPSDGNSIPETSNGSSALVSTGSAGPSSSSGGAPC